MIYRPWSLLTGPAAMCGGIVAAVVVANFFIFKEYPFLKPEKKSDDSPRSSN